MSETLRKTKTLFKKDLLDVIKNPVVFLLTLMPIAFTILFTTIFDDMGEGIEPTTYLLILATGYTAGIVGSMAILNSMAEEREKMTLRTLMLAHVTGSQIMISKTLVASILLVLVNTICYFIIGGELEQIGLFLLIVLGGSLSIVLISLIFGLLARDQSSASLFMLPILVFAMIPLFANFNETIGTISDYTPCGAMANLLTFMVEGNLFTGDALRPLAVMLAWIVAMTVIFIIVFKRNRRDN